MSVSAVMTSHAEESDETGFLPANTEILCEIATEYEGLVKNPTPYGTTLGSNVVGAWAKYDNIDFGQGDIKDFMLYIGVQPGYEGGTVEVYIDSLTSEPIASMLIVATPGWNTFEWQSVSVNNSEIVGVHTVYLKLTGRRALGNVRAFKFSSYSFGDVEGAFPTDIAGTQFEKAYRLLHSVGILEETAGNSYSVNKKITSEDMIKFGARIMNISDNEENITFLAERMGIDRNDNADLITAAKLSAYILGYAEKAKMSADYAAACLTYIKSKDIFKNVTVVNDVLTKGDMLQLAYNILESKMAVVTQIGTGWMRISKGNDTSLSVYHSILKDTGIVDGNMYTTLTGTSKLRENVVTIDGVRFEEGDTDASSMLGRSVNFYYTNDGDMRSLVCIEEKGNTIVTFEDDDFISYTSMQLKYYNKQGKVITLNMDKSVDFIYNRVVLNKYDTSVFDDFRGSITLVDNDGNNRYDIIEMTDTYDLVVDYISDDVIYEKYGSGKIDISDAVLIVKNHYGALLDASDIYNVTSGNVLTVKEAVDFEGTKVCEIIIARKSASGVVNSLSDDNIMEVNGKKYKLSDKVKYSTDNNELCIGDEAVFYLNAAGEVVMIHFKEITNLYGYLIGADGGKGLDKTVKVKIFSQNGDMGIYECQKRVEIDGKSYKNADEIYYLITSLNGAGGLVMYGVNSNGYITSIDFPYDHTGNTPVGKNSWEKENSVRLIYHNTANQSYNSGSGSIGGYATDSGSAIAFCIPPSGTDEYYLVENARDLFVSGYSYKVKAYSTDIHKLTTDVYVLDQFADDVEFFKVVNSIGETSSDIVCYICDFSSVFDEAKDKIMTKIIYYCAGKLQTVLVDDTVMATASDIAIGDSVRIKSKNGYALNIEKMFDMSERTIDRDNTSESFTSARSCRMGNVEVKSGTFFKLFEYDEVYNAASANIYIYDSSLRDYPITLGTKDDILDNIAVSGGSFVVINAYSGKPVAICIIRK